ncbi:MAG: hypothetical protein F6J93_01235 [Oscillatoria sp. SIO1A7]|nr:hypothetical protein [Oscillatoria sp. SIO1A7]
MPLSTVERASRLFRRLCSIAVSRQARRPSYAGNEMGRTAVSRQARRPSYAGNEMGWTGGTPVLRGKRNGTDRRDARPTRETKWDGQARRPSYGIPHTPHPTPHTPHPTPYTLKLPHTLHPDFLGFAQHRPALPT